MIKLYITAIQSNKDGTAVTLFEDYLLGYENKDLLLNAEESINQKLFNKVEEVELQNQGATSPF